MTVIFPDHLLRAVAYHFKNPKASSNTDVNLISELRKYDKPNGTELVSDLSPGSVFKLYNGRIFKRGTQRVKRIECIEIKTGKLYLFHPNAEVKPITI